MCYLLTLFVCYLHFKSGALRTITNIVEKGYTSYGKLKKRIPLQMYIKGFLCR